MSREWLDLFETGEGRPSLQGSSLASFWISCCLKNCFSNVGNQHNKCQKKDTSGRWQNLSCTSSFLLGYNHVERPKYSFSNNNYFSPQTSSHHENSLKTNSDSLNLLLYLTWISKAEIRREGSQFNQSRRERGLTSRHSNICLSIFQNWICF